MKQGDLLLITDMQNVYKAGHKWACLNTCECALNINSIIKEYISSCNQKNVIFTKYIASSDPHGVWKDYNIKYKEINDSPYENDLVDELKEVAVSFDIYTKDVYSSLAVPEVLDRCRKAKRVIITGVVAECCVLSTVLALIDEGIYTVYLTDAVSGLDTPKEEATKLILSGLSPLHVLMKTTQEYLNEH